MRRCSMNEHCVVDAISRNRPYFRAAHSFQLNEIMFYEGKNVEIVNRKLSEDDDNDDGDIVAYQLNVFGSQSNFACSFRERKMA